MYRYTVVFADNTKAYIQADNIEDAYFRTISTYSKQIIDIFLD